MPGPSKLEKVVDPGSGPCPLWRMAFLAILIMSGNAASSADHTNLVLL